MGNTTEGQGTQETLGDLVGRSVDKAVSRTEEVARREVSETKEALRADARALTPSLVAFGAGSVLLLGGLFAVGLGAAKKLLEHPAASVVVGLTLLSGACGIGILAVRSLPPEPLGRLRSHSRRELGELAK